MTFKGNSLKILHAGSDFVPDYKKMYLILFNAITDALEALNTQKFVLASTRLIEAQQRTEALYIGAHEGSVERQP